MNTVLTSAIAFIIAIGILVTIHEFGHFWVARKLGVRVLRFSIGFGRPIWRWHGRRDRTEYVIASIPLGGYVKMLDEREGEVADDELPMAFNRQPLYVRTAIVSAGPVFNFLFAIAAYWLMFVIGITGLKPVIGEIDTGSAAELAGLRAGQTIIAIDNRATPTWETVLFAVLDRAMDNAAFTVEAEDDGMRRSLHRLDTGPVKDILNHGNLLGTLGIHPQRPEIPPVIGHLESGSPADRAGLRAGDRLLRADGTSITDWRAWVGYVRERPGQRLSIEIERDGRPLTLEILPDRKTDPSAGTIGYIGAAVQLPPEGAEAYRAVLQYPPAQAVGQALAKTWAIGVLTLRMLVKMLFGEASVENISGPISIAQYAGYSANVGLSQFLAFLAVVSVSLGILNLLPVPLLDGGHLLYYLVEFVKGSPVSEYVQLIGQRIGIAVLGGLMFLAFYNDIVRLFR